MSWFKTGTEGETWIEKQDQKKAEEFAASRDPLVYARKNRFKLKYDCTGYIVPLDDLVFFCNEHQFEKMFDGKRDFYNYETCIQDIEGECPLCESQNRGYPAAVMTVIDLTEYKKKDGTMSKGGIKKIVVLKKGGRALFLKKRKRLGGLAFKKFEIYRSKDEKGEATGSILEYEKDVDPEVLKKLAPEGIDPNEWIKPYNYEELFAPKSAAELRRIIGLSDPVGASESEKTYEEPEKKSIKDLI